MSTVRENILANLKTTLEGITEESGYNNTVESVQRWLQRGNSIREVPCIIITAGPEEKNPNPNPYMTCRLTVYLDVFLRQPETDTGSTDTLINSILGDIDKALMVDYTRGGYAKDTNIRGNMPFETLEGQANAGIIVELEIIYQHQQTDPAVSG